MAVASAEPYASLSRSRQITMPVPHHSSFLQAECPSCHPTNSVKALKAKHRNRTNAAMCVKMSVAMISKRKLNDGSYEHK